MSVHLIRNSLMLGLTGIGGFVFASNAMRSSKSDMGTLRKNELKRCKSHNYVEHMPVH
jgi:hypothetical protein